MWEKTHLQVGKPASNRTLFRASRTAGLFRRPSTADQSAMYLITSAAWASGRVSDSVVEVLRGKGQPVRVLVTSNDGRANRFRELGAEVVVADLTNAVDVVEAMNDVTRMFFNTHIS